MRWGREPRPGGQAGALPADVPRQGLHHHGAAQAGVPAAALQRGAGLEEGLPGADGQGLDTCQRLRRVRRLRRDGGPPEGQAAARAGGGADARRAGHGPGHVPRRAPAAVRRRRADHWHGRPADLPEHWARLEGLDARFRERAAGRRPRRWAAARAGRAGLRPRALLASARRRRGPTPRGPRLGPAATADARGVSRPRAGSGPGPRPPPLSLFPLRLFLSKPAFSPQAALQQRAVD
mmetsp:Transcript_121279/g.329181  ORF Transcript_121279/g.329181 Transcript_121279/m.329181 type:complete len:236 (-) Transcript_121279:140-847(-)